MRSPCQLREPGPSHRQLPRAGDGSLPESGPCWPLRTSRSRLVRGCSPPLWQPFLFEGDLLRISQSRGRVRRRQGGAWETRAGKAPSTLSSTGRAESMSCTGGPPTPTTRCRAAAHTLLKATPRPRQAVLLTRPSHHPSVLQKRNRLGKGASWTPGFRRMPTCSGGCWEGALAGPTLEWSRGGSSPTPFSARAPLPGHPPPPSQEPPDPGAGNHLHGARLDWVAHIFHLRAQRSPGGMGGCLPGTWRESPTSPHSRAPWLYVCSVCLRL